MGTSSLALKAMLRELAGRQGGYFTAAQAIGIGYKDSTHGYHVRRGHWQRVGWGIYRLTEVGVTPWSELHRVLLWSRNKSGRCLGIFVGTTALAIKNNDSALVDTKNIELCVPRNFRRFAPTPDGVNLIFEDLCESCTQIINGLPINCDIRVGIISGLSIKPKINDGWLDRTDRFDKMIAWGED